MDFVMDLELDWSEFVGTCEREAERVDRDDSEKNQWSHPQSSHPEKASVLSIFDRH
jgi:hypothetical protein